MKILAIESSQVVASVAVAADGNILGEYTINNKMTHSETLMPMVAELLKTAGVEKSELDYIAVSEGPGSFTGLRIGVAIAKGLGLALEKPVIGVPSVEALAYNFYGREDIIVPMMDARKGRVYGGVFQFVEDTLKVLKETDALTVEELIEQAEKLAGEKTIIFLGDGVKPNLEKIENCVKKAYKIAPASLTMQRASYIAQVAEQKIDANEITTAAEMKPDYLRPSQAERELAEKTVKTTAEKED